MRIVSINISHPATATQSQHMGIVFETDTGQRYSIHTSEDTLFQEQRFREVVRKSFHHRYGPIEVPQGMSWEEHIEEVWARTGGAPPPARAPGEPGAPGPSQPQPA